MKAAEKPCAKCNALFVGRFCKPCRKAYQAAWHVANYAKNKKRICATNEKWRAENLDRVRQCERLRYAANRERARARKRSRYGEADRQRSNDWYWKHLDVSRAVARASANKWRRENPALVNALSAKKRATKLSATPSWANEFFISEAYHLAKLRTKMLGFKWHVDHTVPLRSKLVCGLHVENNLAVIPGSANMSKGNRSWPDMP